MPRINTRAIAKLEEAQKALKKLGRSTPTEAGQAFAAELIATLKKGKPAVATLGDETVSFKPEDVRVSRTHVMIGKIDVPLTLVRYDNNDNYVMNILVDDVNLLAETCKLEIGSPVFAAA